MSKHERHVEAIAKLMAENFTILGQQFTREEMRQLVEGVLRNYFPRTEWKEWDDPANLRTAPISWPRRWYQVSIVVGGRKHGVKSSVPLEEFERIDVDRYVASVKRKMMDRLARSIAEGIQQNDEASYDEV